MILRPQFQLRLRSEGQFAGFKNSAVAAGVSMNEWFLRRIEDAGSEGSGEDALRGAVKPPVSRVARRVRAVPDVVSAPGGDSGAVAVAAVAVEHKTAFSGFANQIDRFVAEKQSGHDAKTCRVYKCGICSALKSKEK